MSDVIETTETHIVRKVDGMDRTFNILSPYDRADLLRPYLKELQEARTARKQKLVENLKLAGITGADMLNELEHFDDEFPERVTDQDWVNYVNDPMYTVSIYAKSLSSLNGEAEAVARKALLPFSDKVKICGLVLVPKTEETPDPNSPTPATYETPAQTTSTGQPPKPE